MKKYLSLKNKLKPLVILTLFGLLASNGQTKIDLEVFTDDEVCAHDSISNLVEFYSTDSIPKKVFSHNFKNCFTSFQLPNSERGNFKIKLIVPGNEIAFDTLTISKIDTKKNIYLKSVKKPKVTEQAITENSKSISVLRAGKEEKFYDALAGKTTVNVEGNDLLSNGNAWETMEKLPGVLVSPEGIALVNGKPSKIWIDGEPTGLSGTELSNFLKSLPANSVEKIEIISNPGAKYDANTAGGIINIITGRNKVKGTSGSINSSYSINDYNKSQTSLNLGSRFGSASLNLITGFNYNEGEERQTFFSDFKTQAPRDVLLQNQLTERLNRNFFVRSTNQFKIGRKARLTLKYNLNMDWNDPNTFGNLKSELGPINILTNNSTEIKNTRHEVSAKINTPISRRVDYTGRITYSNLSSNNLALNTETILLNKNYSNINQRSDINNFLAINDFEIDLENWDSKVETGISLDFLNVNNNGLYDLDNLNDISVFTNPIYTDRPLAFDYKESNFAAYFNVNKKIGAWNVGLGVRSEYLTRNSFEPNTNIAFKADKLRLFPTVDLLYKISENINWSINYRRKITRIPYSELDPNVSSTYNSLSEEIGNPLLSPSIINKFETRISILEYISLSFSYDNTKNPNLFIIQSPSDYNINRQRANFRSSNTYTANFTLPIPFQVLYDPKGFFSNKNVNPTELSFLYLQGGFIYSEYEGAEEFVPINKPLPYLGMYSQILLPSDFKLSLFYLYFGKGTYQSFLVNRPSQGLNVNLSKSFFKDKIKAQVQIADVFDTKEIDVDLFSNDLDINFIRKEDTRFLRFSLTYSFGKFKVDNDKENAKRLGSDILENKDNNNELIK